MSGNEEVMAILGEAKKLASRYKALTGKPLGITGEIAEYEAARLLGVELTPARQAGYDAVEYTPTGLRTLQIKGRVLARRPKAGQRLGSIDTRKEWNALLMVLLDEQFEATEIYEADRAAVIEAIERPGSVSRNERGALGVNVIKRIGQKRWSR